MKSQRDDGAGDGDDAPLVEQLNCCASTGAHTLIMEKVRAVRLSLKLKGNSNADKRARKKLNKQLRQYSRELKALEENYSLPHTPGCYTAYLDASWVLGSENLYENTFENCDNIPEISIDPDTGLLSVVNSETNLLKSFNISVGGNCLPARGQGGELLVSGETKTEDGQVFACLSLVLVLRPRTVVDVCHLSDIPRQCDSTSSSCSLSRSFIVSDVKTFIEPHNLHSDGDVVLPFPLRGGPFLCTQGIGGRFTHFFVYNFHAIDIAAPVGTPVLAVGDGIIVEVNERHKVQGILATNLFKWNSIVLQLDSRQSEAKEETIFVEYVHIEHKSSQVAPGDRVSAGDVICYSGSVGFSPVPHLHIQVASSGSADAPTIPFRLLCRSGHTEQEAALSTPAPQVLRSGNWYGP